MPSSPPRFQEEKEGGQDGNSSSCSESEPPPAKPPSSPSEQSSQQQNTTMLMLVGGETRLMSTRSELPVHGQTERVLPPPLQVSREIPTGPTEEFVNGSLLPKHAQLHVDNSASERKKNDIIPVPTEATSTTEIADHISKEIVPQSADDHAGQIQAAPESEHPSNTSTSASLGLQPQPLLSAEIVNDSTEGAVASVAAAQPQGPADSEADPDESKMSIDNLLPTKKPRRKRKPQVKPGQSTGRWTVSEHRAFLDGLRECGREWKKVALRIPTRTSAQIRSHAQKYFSKLQRDHESLVNQGDSSNAAAVAADSQQMRPSVQRSVDRIMANPHEAQREVENTLEALRERYRQLQLRLEQRQRARTNGNRGQMVEDDTSSSTNHREALEENESNDCSVDDQSSVSSAVSASIASIASAGAAARDLGNEELIALHVLGGDLPRGDASADGAGQGAPGVRMSPDSSDNSTESEVVDDAPPPKRMRKEA